MSNQEPTSGLSRRSVTQAAAWTVPAVAVAVGAPMAAASNTVGQVIVTAPTSFVRPGATYPDIIITMNQPVAGGGAVVNTTNATITVTLPAGYTWAGGTNPTDTTRVFPNVVGGTVVLTGANAVVAAQDPTGAQTGGPITAAAVDNAVAAGNPTSYTMGTATLTTAYNGVGSGTSSGAMWADNTSFMGFAVEGYTNQTNPIAWATPMDEIPNAAGNIVDVTAGGANGGFMVRRDSATTTTVYGNYTTGIYMQQADQQYSSYRVVIPAGKLLTGEYIVQVSGGMEVLTNFGRLFSFASANQVYQEMPQYTFGAAGSVQPFFTQVVGTRYGLGGSGAPTWSVALTKDGHVWAMSNLLHNISNPSYAGDGQSHTDLRVPVQVQTAPGVPLANIVEVSTGVGSAMALTSSGQVYTWGSNTSGFRAGGGGNYATLVSGLPPIAKLGQTSMTESNNYGTVSVVAVSGELYSWGSDLGFQNNTSNNTQNSLAYSGVTLNHTMDTVRGTRKIVDVANVGPSTAVILDDNSVWTWGANGTQFGSAGYLGGGPGSLSTSATPVRVRRWKAGVGSPVDHFATKFFDSNYQTYASDAV